MTRTYEDPCGLARALDLVGERWAMLVVRELLLGPKRFADLRRGLPGVSQSVLTQRLGRLEEIGVVARRDAGPPVSAKVYELTPHGRGLEPALLALATWGSRTPITTPNPLSADAFALALRTTYAGGADDVRVLLETGGDTLLVSVTAGRLEVARSAVTDPVATVRASIEELTAIVYAGQSLDGVDVSGDRRAAEELLRRFPVG